jgi:hypothetical protein
MARRHTMILRLLLQKWSARRQHPAAVNLEFFGTSPRAAT